MRGFTLIELIVVISVLVTLLAFTYPSLLTSTRRTQLTESITVLASDIREQQFKTMTGDAGGAGPLTEYGIYFESDRYIIFTGSVYSAADPGNFTVMTEPSVTFSSITYPGSQIVFTKGSGEVSNFVADSYNLTITDSVEGLSRVITLNKYGVITQIN